MCPGHSVSRKGKRHSLRHAVSVLRILRRSIRPIRRIRLLRRVIVISGHGVCAIADGVAGIVHRVSDGIACIVHAFADVITDGIRIGVVPLINSVVGAIVGAIAVVCAVILLLLPQPQTNSIVSAASRAISFFS